MTWTENPTHIIPVVLINFCFFNGVKREKRNNVTPEKTVAMIE